MVLFCFFGWGQIRLSGLPLFVSVCFFFLFLFKVPSSKGLPETGAKDY